MSTPEDQVGPFPTPYWPAYLDYITNPGGGLPQPGADAVPSDQYVPASPPVPPGFSPYIPATVLPSAPSLPTAPAPPVLPGPSLPPSPSLPSPLPPSATPPTSTPSTPPEPFRPSGRTPSGGYSWESYERMVERAMRDARVRQTAPPRVPIPEGVIIAAGGIFAQAGVLIGGLLWPSSLGNGELDQRQRDEAIEDYESSLGEDIARGGGVAIGGIVLGGMVVLDQLGRLPPAVFDQRDEPFELDPIPTPDIGAPTVVGPDLEELAAPPVPELELPPAPVVPQVSQARVPTSSPAPTAPPATIPTFGQWTSVIARILTNRRSTFAQETRSALTPDLATPPTPTPVTPTDVPFADPLTPPRIPGLDPLTSTPTSSLTASNTSTLGWAPPRTPTTRTRTKECECDKPKKRKPPRKCRARAGVIWASGPKKGKPAGNRCISFEGKP